MVKTTNHCILITGGAGYIGSHTVHYLIQHGFNPENIIVFDNLIYGHKEFLPKNIVFVRGDLKNKKQIDTVFKKNQIDSVIHFAAYAYVGESMRDPGKYFDNNLLGGLNLLNSMVQYGCKKIIFSSTCATYGIPKKLPIDEKTKQNPINPYGESKLMFEKILEWYWNIHEIRSIRLRYFNASGAAYGIGESHNPETHLIPLMFENILGKTNSIKIFGSDYETKDGTCVRDYIHVVDLADAHHKALEYLENHNVSLKINLGTGTGTSVKEIIEIGEKVSGKRVIIEYQERRPGDPDILISDPTYSHKILGWKAKHTINDIISSAWKWHLNQEGK